MAGGQWAMVGVVAVACVAFVWLLSSTVSATIRHRKESDR